tara:strand:+ start:790 stop:957 length:168 start_codon:yes stop_codon:yes gene_type:complete
MAIEKEKSKEEKSRVIDKSTTKEFIKRSTAIKKGMRHAVTRLDDAIERAVEKDRY